MQSTFSYGLLTWTTSLSSCPRNEWHSPSPQIVTGGFAEMGMNCTHWCGGDVNHRDDTGLASHRPFLHASQTSIMSQVSGVKAKAGCVSLSVICTVSSAWHQGCQLWTSGWHGRLSVGRSRELVLGSSLELLPGGWVFWPHVWAGW